MIGFWFVFGWRLVSSCVVHGLWFVSVWLVGSVTAWLICFIWLVAWQVGWLIGWLVGWLDGWLVG